MRFSALARSEHAQRCVDLDRSTVDLERLDDYGWSSGERILVDLIRAMWNGSGGVTVHDLTRLDDENRRVAVMAIGAWLLEPEEAYT